MIAKALSPEEKRLDALPSIFAEEHLSLGQAAKLIPSVMCEGEARRSVTRTTVLRWVTRGFIVPGQPEGERVKVKLEAVRLPVGFLTSREAVGRFLKAIQPGGLQGESGAGKGTPASSPAKRKREADAALEGLRKHGLKV